LLSTPLPPKNSYQIVVTEVAHHDSVHLDDEVAVLEAGLFGLRFRTDLVDVVSSARGQADLQMKAQNLVPMYSTIC
jgi:hypothetical protein